MKRLRLCRCNECHRKLMGVLYVDMLWPDWETHDRVVNRMPMNPGRWLP